MTSLRLSLLAVALPLILGCSNGIPAVEGTVRLNEQPLATGSITFFPVEGTAGQEGGSTVANGKYKIERGLTVGKYRVEIRSSRKTNKKIYNPVMPSELIDEEVAAIPPEYNEKSRIIREVRPDSNTFDFDVSSAKARK